jgi:hypothetical protein
MKKKNNKRTKTKYPGLKQNLNLRSRYEELDQNYLNGVFDENSGEQIIRPLTDDEKDYLNRFNEEYTNANYNHGGKRIHPVKKKESEKNKFLIDVKLDFVEYLKKLNKYIEQSILKNKSKNQIKKSVNAFKKSVLAIINKEFKNIKDTYQKDSYDRNNSRNRCLVTKTKAMGKTYLFDDLPKSMLVNEEYENDIIEMIDLKSELTKKFQNGGDGSDSGQ